MAQMSRSIIASIRTSGGRILVAAEGRSASSTRSRNRFSTNIGKDGPAFRRHSPSRPRFPVELSYAESLIPLHSAIASARLTSRLAFDSRSQFQEDDDGT